jgi:tetratricopeptide (TPR) repeat protein
MKTWRRPLFVFGERSGSVRVHALLTMAAVLAGMPASAQSDEWWRVMRTGLEADNAGDYAKCLPLYREAVEIAEKLGPMNERRAYSWNALGEIQDLMGDYAAAESAYRRALKAAEQSRGKLSPPYTLALENLATLYAETGQQSRAERLAREALALVSEFSPPDELGLAMARGGLAMIVDRGGRHEEAIRLSAAALAVLERYPTAWGQVVATLDTMGTAFFVRGDTSEAERLFQRALAVTEERAGAEHPLLTRVLCNLGVVAARMGRHEEAGERLRRAIAIAAQRLGTTHPMYGSLLATYAALLRQTGEKARAKVMETQSSQILRENRARNGLGSVIDVSALRRK